MNQEEAKLILSKKLIFGNEQQIEALKFLEKCICKGDCPDCGGTGECYACGHLCDECDGTGKI